MGRPKKEEVKKEEAPQKPSNRKPVPTQDELDKMDFVDMKLCPKCKEDRPKGPRLDIHKNYRCFCPTCKFWDSVVSLTPVAAVEKWNRAGGPEIL